LELFDIFSHLFDEAAVLVDRDHLVVRVNDAAIDLLGEHIVGKPLENFLRHPEFFDALGQAQDENMVTDMNYTRHDHMRRDFKIRFAPFFEAHTLILFFDITGQRNIERIQSEFVANVSHELRSPLTALSGFIETLQTTAADDRRAREKFLGIMHSEAQRMQRLIDGLLSLSRVEAEEHRPPRDVVGLVPIIENAVSAFDARARDDDRKIEIILDEAVGETPLTIMADPDELSEVFHNLLENALKYGNSGTPVQVRIGSGRGIGQQLRDDLVRVEVINFGDTIDEQHISRLTERFYRVDKGRSRKMGGTGLGLAIVKHIVNRHRGRLRISSQSGVTGVAVTLPLNDNAENADAQS
jgi:two-component system phosphate regulon sensor histidine kinase PhoR